MQAKSKDFFASPKTSLELWMLAIWQTTKLWRCQVTSVSISARKGFDILYDHPSSTQKYGWEHYKQRLSILTFGVSVNRILTKQQYKCHPQFWLRVKTEGLFTRLFISVQSSLRFPVNLQRVKIYQPEDKVRVSCFEVEVIYEVSVIWRCFKKWDF